MIRHTQNIEECEHCNKVFENCEDYWKDARNKCYCIDNACGWEDDDTSDGNCTIPVVVGRSEQFICPECKEQKDKWIDKCEDCTLKEFS